MIVFETDAAVTLSNDSENPCSGAYLDKVVYDVFYGGEIEEIGALQAG